MKKGLVSINGRKCMLIALLAMLLGLLFAASAQASTIRMTVGNNYMFVDLNSVRLDAAPYIKDGRTMVPVSAIAQVFGADVGAYNTESGLQARIEYNNVMLFLTVGDRGAHFVNQYGEDTAVLMDVAPEIKYSRMCVPLSFIARGFGASVSWDAPTRTAIISDEGERSNQSSDWNNPYTYLPNPGMKLHYYLYYPDGEEGYETMYTRKPSPSSGYWLDTATIPDVYGGVPDYKNHYVAVQDGIYEFYESGMPEDSLVPYLKDGLYKGQTWSYTSDNGNIYWKVVDIDQTIRVKNMDYEHCLVVDIDNRAVYWKFRCWYAPQLGLVYEKSMPDGSVTKYLDSWQTIR